MEAVDLTPEVEKLVALLFDADRRPEVRAMLIDECGTNIPGWKSAGLERLRCAVLKLSEGRVEKLRRAVDLAKIDFRDVLMAANFGEPSSYLNWLPGPK